MLIYIKTLNGEILTFEVQPSQIIEETAEQVGEATKCPDIRLIYGGKQLRKDVPFEYYGISDGATLWCVIPLGGSSRNFNPGEKLLRDAKDQECAVCFEELSPVSLARPAMALPCKHFEFCAACLATQKECPLCRGPIKIMVSNTQ